MNGPQPAPQAQHSQDEGPDELAAGIRQRRLVPLHPRGVHKSLNVLQKRSEVLWFISFYSQIPESECRTVLPRLPLLEMWWQKCATHTGRIPRLPAPASAGTASSTMATWQVPNVYINVFFFNLWTQIVDKNLKEMRMWDPNLCYMITENIKDFQMLCLKKNFIKPLVKVHYKIPYFSCRECL